MHRDQKIQNNTQDLDDGFEEEKDYGSTSLYLTEEYLKFLDSFEDSSRSETLRRIIDWFREHQPTEKGC